VSLTFSLHISFTLSFQGDQGDFKGIPPEFPRPGRKRYRVYRQEIIGTAFLSGSLISRALLRNN